MTYDNHLYETAEAIAPLLTGLSLDDFPDTKAVEALINTLDDAIQTSIKLYPNQ